MEYGIAAFFFSNLAVRKAQVASSYMKCFAEPHLRPAGLLNEQP